VEFKCFAYVIFVGFVLIGQNSLRTSFLGCSLIFPAFHYTHKPVNVHVWVSRKFDRDSTAHNMRIKAPNLNFMKLKFIAIGRLCHVIPYGEFANIAYQTRMRMIQFFAVESHYIGIRIYLQSLNGLK
jgi:hypothetical protein